jgi:hypothetical protein
MRLADDSLERALVDGALESTLEGGWEETTLASLVVRSKSCGAQRSSMTLVGIAPMRLADDSLESALVDGALDSTLEGG